MKKYPLNTTVDKTEIFNYAFITESRTVSYIKENGHVMFIIRGSPYTGKTAISQMLMQTYPNAVYCSSVKLLNTLSPKEETKLPKELKVASCELCRKKVKDACIKNEKIIIVQNTHIKRFEIQPYLNLAAKYDYTVIMIATNNRFEITPEAIAKIKPSSIDLNYLMRRFYGWHCILPVFTGWFISTEDSLYIHNFILKSLESLLEVNRFCKLFNVCNAEELRKCFHLRKVLSCIAAYFEDPLAMKEYDSSDKVQESYGRISTVNVVGYLVSVSGIIGIAQVDEVSKWLIPGIKKKGRFIKKQEKGISLNKSKNIKIKRLSFKNSKKSDAIGKVTGDVLDVEEILEHQEEDLLLKENLKVHVDGKKEDNNKTIHKTFSEKLRSNKLREKLKITGEATKNVLHHGKTFKLQENNCLLLNRTMTLEEWSSDENIDITRSCFIHLGQRNFDLFDIPKIQKEFEGSLKLISDNRGIISNDIFVQVGNGTKICELSENVWLVRAPQIICVETVFTGFYA